jgi:voltage-gated potassium channel Kch
MPPEHEASFDATPEADEPPADLAADLVPLRTRGKGRRKHRVDAYQKDSLDAEKAYEQALKAAEAGDEEKAVQKFLRAAKVAETAHEWYLAAVSLRRVGDYLLRPGGVFDLDRGLRLYRRAAAAYEDCGLFAEARELSYRVLYLKMRFGRHIGLSRLIRAELFFYWATSGFGIRPLRVVGMGVVLVFSFALLYLLLGGVVTPEGEAATSFGDAVYFSGVTFATIGYGDLLPATHVRGVALAEGALGVITMSYFVIVLSNRLTKT